MTSMFRFTIRDMFWLTVVVAMVLGWWNEHRRFVAYYELVNRNIKWSEAGPGAKAILAKPEDSERGTTQEGAAEPAKEDIANDVPTALYADADIERLTTQRAVGQQHVVVPLGQSLPRRIVFNALGIDRGRLVDFRTREAGHDVTMAWQFSPSYDLVCVTAQNEPGPLPPFDHPNRKIYGVHFHKRTGDPDDFR